MGKGGAGMPGAPKGLGLGIKLLAAGAAAVYGINQSMYTGKYESLCNRDGRKMNRIVIKIPLLEKFLILLSFFQYLWMHHLIPFSHISYNVIVF